jgi:hypothetical protein
MIFAFRENEKTDFVSTLVVNINGTGTVIIPLKN